MRENISGPAPPVTRKAGGLSVLLATGLGLGYIPVASGTWGSLGSLALYILFERCVPRLGAAMGYSCAPGSPGFLVVQAGFVLILALVGVKTSEIAAVHFGETDPGRVVIDEVSGQQIVFLGLAPVNWKYLLAGFLLFRIFDIWKPSPARQSESLPGGWGIMVDDWFAALYALLILWAVKLFYP